MSRFIHTVTPYVVSVMLVSCACAFFIGNDPPVQYSPEVTNTTLGSIKVIDYNKKIKLKPVTRSEFKRKMRETANRYDLLRIFFDRTDLPEDVVDDLIDAGSFETARRWKPRGRNSVPRLYRINDPQNQMHSDTKLPMQGYDGEPFQLDGIDEVFDFMGELEEHPMFGCRLPQPEILRVSSNGESGKIYYPECVIVHRCRNVSGCCEDETQHCGPKSIARFRRPFLVVEMVNGRSDFVQPNKKMVAYRTFINHTECECKNAIKPKGCDKLCPVPYSKFRSGAKCTCGCRQDSLRCKAIKNGFESLQTSQLLCIKDGRCQIPKCQTGKFNVRTGFCPMTLEEDFLPPHKFLKRQKHKHSSHRSRSRSMIFQGHQPTRRGHTGSQTRDLSYSNRAISSSTSLPTGARSRTTFEKDQSKKTHKSRKPVHIFLSVNAIFNRDAFDF